MEFIESLLTLIAGFVFYGVLIVVALIMFVLVATVGFGLFAVYILHNIRSNFVVSPFTTDTGMPVDYHIIEDVAVHYGGPGISHNASVWYQADIEFCGVKLVVIHDGRDIISELPAHELERINDVAEHAWEQLNGQP